MENLKKFISLFKDSPTWLRCLIAILVSALMSIYLFCSCGQTVRVTVRDTPNGVSISTTQHKQDSSGTNININPNINFQRP